MVLAGGEGKRLYPLTRDRAKPAVPFGGRYRIIDFVLSNFVNSGIFKISVLTQYKSGSLMQHLARGWQLAPHMRAQLVLDALEMANGLRRPTAGLIAHSDRGSQIYESDLHRPPRRTRDRALGRLQGRRLR